jgi:hypothetical protein
MKIFKCLMCGGNLSEPKINLGKSALANACVKEPIEQETYPLELCCCLECNSFQLNEIVDPEILFKDYCFVAGTSAINRQHFKNYAEMIVGRFSSFKDDLIVEIASNDNTFLKELRDIGCSRLIGIDPAVNIVENLHDASIKNICGFFSKETAKEMVTLSGKAKICIANNVLAHIPDINGIIDGVDILLDENGIFIFEVAYLPDMCKNVSFDLLYMEHTFSHHLKPLIELFDRHNMEIFDCQKINTHGGSMRVFVKKASNRTLVRSNILDEFIFNESLINDEVDQLNYKIQELKQQLLQKLSKLKEQGKQIVIFGMPAKATTLLYAFDLSHNLFDYAVDDNPLKQNMYSPGKHIPIYSSKKLYDTTPSVVLILSWNFAESIMQNHSALSVDWIVPIPTLKEYVK